MPSSFWQYFYLLLLCSLQRENFKLNYQDGLITKLFQLSFYFCNTQYTTGTCMVNPSNITLIFWSLKYLQWTMDYSPKYNETFQLKLLLDKSWPGRWTMGCHVMSDLAKFYLCFQLQLSNSIFFREIAALLSCDKYHDFVQIYKK